MCLLGLIFWAATALNGRIINKYLEQGTVAKAVVVGKEKEKIIEGRRESSNNYIRFNVLIGNDSIYELSSDYVDDDRYASTKKGDMIDVLYFPEDLQTDETTGRKEFIGGNVMIKSALEDSLSNRTSYYIVIACCFVIGILPLFFGRKKNPQA